MRADRSPTFPFKKAMASVAAVLGLALAVDAADAATAGWTATRTKAHALAYAVGTDQGAMPDVESVPIAVTLALRDRAGLTAITDRLQANGGAPVLTSRQFLDRHAPTAEQVNRVVSYLRSNGFQNIAVADNRLLVTADGSPSRIRDAFQAQLHTFDVSGRRAFANVTDALVPSTLSDTVLAVVGLQTVHRARTFVRRFDAGTLAVTGVNPALFAGIYGASGLPSATTATIGIITQGSMTQTVADLKSFASSAGYPAPTVTVVTVGNASSDTSGTDEWNLDTQSSLAAAGGTVSSMRLYTAATLSDAHLTVAYNRAVSENIARVINVSLGECESSASASGVTASDDQIFQAAVAQGQTFSVSSGDSGSYGCGGSSNAQSYPAVSPYVMSIGGTTLSTNGGAWAGETAWSCTNYRTCPQSASGGTGGGVSLTEAAPSWQNAAGVLTMPGKRGVPDIAFDAAPSSGALILINGSTYQVGGTSLSAPLFTGFYSRIQAAHGNTLGFPAPALYAGAAGNPSWFHDVTSGSNGGYSAGVGWDYVTGFGSLQVQNFSASLGGGSSVLTVSFGCSSSGLTATCTDSSTDNGGTIASYAWTFGDGGTATGPNPSHAYAAAGTYTVTETVTESGSGKTASTSSSVTVSSPGATTWTTIANEGQTFTVNGTQTVRYGSGTSWITMTVTNGGTCSNGFFGSDPIYGTAKICQVASSTATTTWTQIATEGQSFTVSGTQTVRYGNGSSWITLTVTGSGVCSNAFFGGDPLYGTVKVCQIATTPVAPAWTKIASEGQAFTVSGTQTVRYGSGTSWITRSVTSSGSCTNTFFGSDPIYGVVKECDIAN